MGTEAVAATRAVIWASLVDDPSGDESLTPEEQEVERERLFKILERVVVWENSNDPEVLVEARAEIDRCFPEGPPPILDPFAGGGAIPLEAQRLGLKALAGDLNPVAVLINKAMIEIPPRFAGLPPAHPDIDTGLNTWSPIDDQRLTVWEVLQYLVAALERSETEAAELLHTLGGFGDRARQLAYPLYQRANDKGWASEAGSYNSLITAWPSLQAGAAATAAGATDTAQQSLL